MNYNCLLQMLSIALKEPRKYAKYQNNIDDTVKQMNSDEWDRFLSVSRAHNVLSLLYNVLETSQYVPADVMDSARVRAQGVSQFNYRILVKLNQIGESFRSEGIEFCVLKGMAAASFFPVPELRKAGDIDILLLDKSKIEKASGILADYGFRPVPNQMTQHHIEMKGPDSMTLELHTMLAEPFDNSKINTYMENLIPKCKKHIAVRTIMGVDIPMLDTAYHAYELLLHMLQHFLRKGFGLKLLCDWVVLWNNYCYENIPDYGNGEYYIDELSAEESEADRKSGYEKRKLSPDERNGIRTTYLKLVKESGLKGFSDMITAVCIRYLGLKQRRVEWMEIDSSLLLKSDSGSGKAKADDVQEFLKEIMAAEEFGKSSGDRMVALRGSGLTAYVREFHHQMHLNYPKAGKCPVFWPVLWTATLFRFLRNNRTVRNNASARDFLKSAGKRGKIVERMKLFK